MKKKLIDTIQITDLLVTGGIFTKIANITSQPLTWLDSALALQLDKEYYLSHSGGKWISNAYDRLIDAEDNGIVTDALLEMAKMILSKYQLSWDKVYSAVNTNYKPLENYDMEQTETPDVTRTKNVNVKTTNENEVYGFNSQNNPVHSGKSITTGSGIENVESETETGTRGLTRHGNIGVTTSQQMLQSEIDLRSNFNFTNHLFDDVDTLLCLLVY